MERKLLGAQVEDELMTYILKKPVQIGEKLPNEFELGEMFRVGRSTIREAVKSLATKGILEVRRGDGTYVKSHCTLTEDPLGLSRLDDKYKLALELFDVRIALEPEIAAAAAGNAAPEDKQRLQALCDEVECAYLAGEEPRDGDAGPHHQHRGHDLCQFDLPQAERRDHPDPPGHRQRHPGRGRGGSPLRYGDAPDL